MLSFLGLLVFKAPYLPWVLLGFSVVMHGTVPKDEMCGIVVGHSMPSLSPRRPKLILAVWYYFNDIFPPLHNGRSPLDPPAWWIRLFDGAPAPVEETQEDDSTEHERNPNEAIPDAVPAQ
ncbi:hypothetical protein OPT61_g5662 [Boeremia exigua]|uniref:Uncharacterized protein n=1 Tax=Boeremia exigua TaxID=749465 RepID=A0ACC2I9I2_9PLEO|nr:hypothetical protein OPT61_g5662 [Boeremia exigua]